MREKKGVFGGHFNAPVNISTAGVFISTQMLITEKTTALMGSITTHPSVLYTKTSVQKYHTPPQ